VHPNDRWQAGVDQVPGEAGAASAADTSRPVDAVAENWQLSEGEWAAISAEVARLGY
jgi:hypothetical protein